MHLKTEAELLLSQTKERFERKTKLLEQRKPLELEIEKENIFEAQERLKIKELKEYFDNTCLESNVLPPELSKKQSLIEKCQSYVASLKNASLLDHVHSKNLSQAVYSESVRSEPKSVRNFSKVQRSDNSKISNNRSPSFKGHESFINLLETPETSGKTKLQTSSNRINPLAGPIDEFIDKLVEGEVTVLTINNLANFTVMNILHKELESRHLPPSELMIFDRNLRQWPEFIADFKEGVHLKQTFSDQLWLERLLNVRRDDAKRSVESISKSKIFMLLH